MKKIKLCPGLSLANGVICALKSIVVRKAFHFVKEHVHVNPTVPPCCRCLQASSIRGSWAPPLSQGINLYESKPNTVGFLLPGTVLGTALLQFWPIRQEGKSAKKLSLSPKMKRDMIIPFPVFQIDCMG